MAKEWYLMNSKYDQLSGFESDALNDFGQDGFMEALESEMAVDIELCNYDLSERSKMRAVIQNRTQDTKLKTFVRHALLPIGTCKAGMYVYYKQRYWLIVGIVDDNMIYEKAILLICNYRISWINDSGKIISRWINAESASQYNNGETNMVYYFVRSDQLMVYLPDDPESLILNSGKRFIIDKRCELYEHSFSPETMMDTSKPVIVYSITRSDTVLNSYTDSGILGFIFTQGEQHDNDGYYVVDGAGYWLCDIPSSETAVALPHCSIGSDSDIIYIDLEPVVFTACFFNSEGAIIESEFPDYEFSIVGDIASDLEIYRDNNSIMISVSNYKLNNKTFDLVLSAEGYETSTKTVKIREFI